MKVVYVPIRGRDSYRVEWASSYIAQTGLGPGRLIGLDRSNPGPAGYLGRQIKPRVQLGRQQLNCASFAYADPQAEIINDQCNPLRGTRDQSLFMTRGGGRAGKQHFMGKT